MAEVSQILEKARELGKLLAESEEVTRYAAAKAVYENDPHIAELTASFNTHKASIAALSKEETADEQAIARHEDKLKDIYGELMSDDAMTEYQESGRSVEQLLEKINNILSFYINGEDPQGCTGSCATCGGCR